MGRHPARRRAGAGRASLRRAGQAQRSRRAFYLSRSGSRSVRRRRGLRNAEGGKMSVLGKLTWAAIPFDQPIIMGATAFMGLFVAAILGWITLKRAWPYLWNEWLTSVDHKRIGVMYMILGLVMLLRGFSDAIMMRTQQAFAAGTAQGYLPPEHFDQIFSAHGTIMIFFVAMPLVIGLMNYLLPLQLGVRDVAFPTLNSVS